jgi:hypothetical protein
MACHICGSTTWIDEDLHWVWCDNPKCRESYSNEKKFQEFLIAFRERDWDRECMGYDD